MDSAITLDSSLIDDFICWLEIFCYQLSDTFLDSSGMSSSIVSFCSCWNEISSGISSLISSSDIVYSALVLFLWTLSSKFWEYIS